MKRKKKSSKRKLYEQSVELAKQIAKVRDNFECQKCGKENLTGNDLQGSHIIATGKDRRLASDPVNIKVLCFRCHMWWHENPIEAYEWFKKQDGRFNYLKETKLNNDKLGSIPESWYKERIDWLKETFPKELKAYEERSLL